MCIGTWLFSYSVTVNNHTPAALAVLGLYVVLEKYRRRPSRRLAAAAGLTAGLVAAADLPVGAVFAVAAVAALWLLAPRRERISAETACIGCGLAVGVWLLWLNYTAYGTVMPLYVAGSEGTFRVVNPGWSYRMSYLFECLLGCRGLFSYQPFLLFALPGAYFLWRGGRFSHVDKVFLVAAAAVMLFYLFFTVEFGGWAYGFRYLMPVIPILWLIAGRWLLEARFRLLKCAIAVPLVAAGIVAALAVPLLRRLRRGQFAAGALHPQRPQHLPGERVRVEFRHRRGFGAEPGAAAALRPGRFDELSAQHLLQPQAARSSAQGGGADGAAATRRACGSAPCRARFRRRSKAVSCASADGAALSLRRRSAPALRKGRRGTPRF